MVASGMRKSRRLYWVLAGIGVILLLLLFFAPSNSWRQSGSTYGRGPDGYGAWFEYMAKQGVSLERSRQPLSQLVDELSKTTKSAPTTKSSKPQTLLQIQPRLTTTLGWIRRRDQQGTLKLDSAQAKWLAAGNNLVVLGIRQPVRDPQFSSEISTDFGVVKIDTGRRAAPDSGKTLLADDAGAVVWEFVPSFVPPDSSDKVQTIADRRPKYGRLIMATTPYLGANAYQEAPGNFKFLADLVEIDQAPIVVDEAIHGYRAPKSSAPAAQGKRSGGRAGSGRRPMGRRSAARSYSAKSVLNYLARTPLLPVVVQLAILLLIAIWAKNRRFGRLKQVEPPKLDNSTAYIQALAGALQQAGSRSFVVDTVSKAELRQIQRQLGLGDQPMELSDLVAAISAQQQPTDDLNAVLRMQSRKSMSDRELLQWLEHLKQLRQQRSS